MKYHVGDFVVLKLLLNVVVCGSVPMIVLGFDKKRKKYYCLSFDYTDCVPDCIIIAPESIIEYGTIKNSYLSLNQIEIIKNYKIKNKKELLTFQIYEYNEDFSSKRIK